LSGSKLLSIAVDLDGVLANTILPLCKTINEHHSTQFKASSFIRWNAWEIARIPKEEFFRTLDEAWYNWKTLPPTEENIGKKVGRLQTLGRVDIVTGRSPGTVAPAHSWLKQHEVPFHSFVRTNGTMEKAELAYDIFIDDSPDLMRGIASTHDKYGIVYTQPWNKDTPRTSRILRVESWDQIPGVVRKITATLK
jgi:5'(3')-deoxyribonucleotidase